MGAKSKPMDRLSVADLGVDGVGGASAGQCLVQPRGTGAERRGRSTGFGRELREHAVLRHFPFAGAELLVTRVAPQ